MLYGIPDCSDRATAYVTAVTYWVFSCRDIKRSPSKGIDTWKFLQKAIEQAATPARNLARYQSLLCDRLVVPALYPKRLSRILGNPDSENVILFGRREGDSLTYLRELTPENPERVFVGPDTLLQDLQLQGISERQILNLAKPTRLGGIPQVIAMLCQCTHEIYKYKPPEEDELIEVEAVTDVV